MRFSVLGSVVVHGVMVGAIVRLAPPPRDPGPRIVTVEINDRKPEAPPAPKPEIEPPAPKPELEPPKPKTAVRSIEKQPTKSEPAPPPQPAAPSVSAETPEAKPETPSVLLPRRAAGVDLKLHSMPSGVIGGQLDGPPPKVAAAPRAEWKPKGTAGDPILGKLDEVKEDPFPLVKQSDGWTYSGPAFKAKIFLDGSVSFDDKNIRDFKGLSGSFDITELIMKGKKQDPYRREKEKFLTHTTDMREKLIKRARDIRARDALNDLPSRLATTWRNEEKIPEARRAEIFAMWKEADLGEAGKEARLIIEQFIRKYLPAGTQHAYTTQELERFNARLGSAKFDPYN